MESLGTSDNPLQCINLSFYWPEKIAKSRERESLPSETQKCGPQLLS